MYQDKGKWIALKDDVYIEREEDVEMTVIRKQLQG